MDHKKQVLHLAKVLVAMFFTLHPYIIHLSVLLITFCFNVYIQSVTVIFHLIPYEEINTLCLLVQRLAATKQA